MKRLFPQLLTVLLLSASGLMFVRPAPAFAQPTPDLIPPAAIRDLRVDGAPAQTYPRGFFTSTHFTITDSVANILNQKFDVIIVGAEAEHSLVAPLKTTLTAGPAMIYSNSVAVPDDWTVIDSHEDWFLHSTPVPSRATRIPLSGPYPYLFYMNVGAQGWRDFLVAKYAAALAADPSSDGIFLDGVMLPSEYQSLLGAAYPGYDAAAYQGLALEFIYAVKDAAAGKPVVVNSELDKAFTLAADGGLCEGFVHFGGWHNDQQITRRLWLADLALIGDRDLDGRVLLVGSGSADTTIASLVEFCYASFLIGYNQYARSHFYWCTNGSHDSPTINWFPVWDMEIGDPTGGYYEVDSVFRRDFSGGMVLVNPNDTGAPVTVSLGAVHVNSTGQLVSTVTLPNKSGAVLKRSSWL